MKRNFNSKETLAWIVLVGAAFLFSVTLAFAQEKKKGSTTIKIIKNENGRTTKIDTTVDANDDEAIQKILKDLDLDHDMNFNFNTPEPLLAPGEKRRKMKFNYNSLSKKDREELKQEMENLKDEMNDLHEQMKDIHIEIHSDNDGKDRQEYSYHFEMPPMPPMPPDMEGLDRDDFWKNEPGKGHHHHFSFSIPDSLNDDEHVTIMGDDDEQPPVFEKEITGKNGEKVFIYKRSKPADDKSKSKSDTKSQIKLFPNPNDGKFTMNFHSDLKSKLSVHVYDHLGKEVYSETINDFDGDYSNQFDLTKNGNGNYILKVTTGEQTFKEKFVIE